MIGDYMKKTDILTAITGFLMAFADSVPGVSGGTIAYITGKYDELISSINNLTKIGDKKQKIKSIQFLIKLGIGWIIGFVIAILFITSIIDSHIYQLSSLFIGFIVVSIPFIIKSELSVLKSNVSGIVFTVIGIIIVVAISYFSSTNLNIMGEELTLVSYIYIFIAGMIAISAMLLPGISGSTLLIIFGLYVPVITAVKNVLKFDFSGFFICLAFGLGILFGLKFTTSLIDKALKKYRSKIVYLIIGLMIGSLYAIAIGPTTLVNEITKVNLGLDRLTIDTFSYLYFIIGVVIIVVLDIVSLKFEK